MAGLVKVQKFKIGRYKMEPQDDFERKIERISSGLNELKKKEKEGSGSDDTFSRQKERWLLENKLKDIPLSAERI